MGLWAPWRKATVMNIHFPPALYVMHSTGWLNKETLDCNAICWMREAAKQYYTLYSLSLYSLAIKSLQLLLEISTTYRLVSASDKSIGFPHNAWFPRANVKLCPKQCCLKAMYSKTILLVSVLSYHKTLTCSFNTMMDEHVWSFSRE